MEGVYAIIAIAIMVGIGKYIDVRMQRKEKEKQNG